MRYLFIGGVADGQWHRVEQDRHCWRVAERFMDVPLDYPGGLTYYNTTVRTDTYLRETIHCPTGDITVYILHGMSPREALLTLMSKYH